MKVLLFPDWTRVSYLEMMERHWLGQRDIVTSPDVRFCCLPHHQTPTSATVILLYVVPLQYYPKGMSACCE